MKESILSAITDFNDFFTSLEKKEKSKVGESFRARCREIPSLMEDTGLTPALSFCYAKATKSVYDNIKNCLENKGIIKDEDDAKKGYAIYFYFLLKKLKELELIEESKGEPIKALEELRKGKERVASKLIRPYIVQLKKLSEAVFKS